MKNEMKEELLGLKRSIISHAEMFFNDDGNCNNITMCIIKDAGRDCYDIGCDSNEALRDFFELVRVQAGAEADNYHTINWEYLECDQMVTEAEYGLELLA